MAQYDRYLHGEETANTSQARRREILALIADDVNALGSEARTPNEILKKINDLQCVVRGKLAKMTTHARGTGGGPATTLTLTAEERVVAQCLHRHQVEGVPGFDSVEEALRTGKCVLFPIWCVACVGGREYVTSVWILQPVNVLCHPQMCRRVLGHLASPQPSPDMSLRQTPRQVRSHLWRGVATPLLRRRLRRRRW